MATPALRIDGADRVAMRILNAEGRIDAGARKVLAQAGRRVRTKQRQLVAKRTKLLMSAITMRTRGTGNLRTVEVGPLIEKVNKQTGDRKTTVYGKFQETGTARMRAHPFVKPSLDGEAERISADLAALLRSAS